jgi:hypothetical protein
MPQDPDDYERLDYTGPWADAHKDHLTLPVPDEGTALGRDLYAFGEHTLTIEIKTNGTEAGPYTATDQLIVRPETIDHTWWNWPAQYEAWAGSWPHVEWKQKYNVSAEFLNRSHYTSKQIEATLLEEYPRGNTVRTWTYPTEHVAAIPRDKTDPVVGSLKLDEDIQQDWEWTSFLCYPTGDTSRLYIYRAEFTVTDGYGNTYAPVSTDRTTYNHHRPWDEDTNGLNFYVLVAGSKVDWATGAFMALAAANLVGWIPYVGELLSGGLKAAGNAMCNQAKDPPEPRPNFLEKVQVKRPSDRSQLVGLLQVAQLISDLTDQASALTEVQSRLLGAWAAGNERGLKLQTTSQTVLLDLLEDTAKSLWHAIEASISSIANVELVRDLPAGMTEEAAVVGDPKQTAMALVRGFAASGSAWPLRSMSISIMRAIRATREEADARMSLLSSVSPSVRAQRAAKHKRS